MVFLKSYFLRSISALRSIVPIEFRETIIIIMTEYIDEMLLNNIIFKIEQTRFELIIKALKASVSSRIVSKSDESFTGETVSTDPLTELKNKTVLLLGYNEQLK